MTPFKWFNWLERQLGALGIAGLAIVAAAIVLQAYGVRPLESKNDEVQSSLARRLANERVSDARLMRDAAPAAKLDAFYRFFDAQHKPTDWLDRLNAIATSSGVELRSADYRLQKNGTRIERYEITLPLTGSYAQIRSFMDRALAEIPVLSLDQAGFKRNNTGERSVQAELRFTLHVIPGTEK
jgi:hypothetical protein